MERFNPTKRRAARLLVIQGLYQRHISDTPPATLADDLLQQPDARKADTLYFKILLEGIIHHSDELDKTFTPFLDRELSTLDPITLGVLRMGTYELMYCKTLPYKVAINEAIAVAKIFGSEDSHKYVNGILDKVHHHLGTTTA